MKLAGYILDKYYSHVKLCFGYFMHLYAAKINDWPTKFQLSRVTGSFWQWNLENDLEANAWNNAEKSLEFF